MRIPDRVVEEIHQVAANNIVDIIQDFIPLKRKGQNYWGSSPFKNEKTPSLAVSPAKGIYKDFSTGKGGNAISFLIEAESMTYVDALTYIAKKFGIVIEFEQGTSFSSNDDAKKQSMFIINEFAASYFHDKLLNTNEGKESGLAYLEKRGFYQDTIKDFKLGFNPDQKDIFTKHALHQKYNKEVLIETGLSIENENGIFDRYRGRIIFPIINLQGKVAGFGGRILKNDKNLAKYVNSPDSLIYNKSNLLFGLYQAKESIRKSDECILTEGYLDVISLHQSGIKNALASSGTALTDQQIGLISRFTKNVLIIFDGDEAGIKATNKAIEMIYAAGLNPSVLLIPDGDDPDSYIQKNGVEKFQNLLKEKVNGMIYKINYLKSIYNLELPQEKTIFITLLGEILGKIKDPVQKGVLMQFTAEKAQVQEQLLVSAANKAQLTQKSYNNQEPQHEEVDLSKVYKNYPQERELLRVLIHCYDRPFYHEEESFHLADILFEQIGEIEFEVPVFNKIKNIIFKNHPEKYKNIVDHFLSNESEEIKKEILNLEFESDELSENWKKKFDIHTAPLDFFLNQSVENALMHYELKKYKVLLAETQEKLKNSSDPNEQDKLIVTQMKLQKIFKETLDKLGIVILP